MKLETDLSSNVATSVSYYGNQLLAPVNATHLATDADGQTYAYASKPEFDHNCGVWFNAKIVARVALFNLGNVEAFSTCKVTK